MKRYTVILVCLVMVAAWGLAVEAKEYTIGIVPEITFIPWVVAEQKGFFAEEEFEVEIKVYRGFGEWVNAFMHERIDFTDFWRPTHVQLLSPEKKIIAVGGYARGRENVMALITAPDIRPEDLTTQKVGMSGEFFLFQWLLWSYLKPHQIKMSDIKIAYMPQEDLVKNFLSRRLKSVIVTVEAIKRTTEGGKGVLVSGNTQEMALQSLVINEQAYTAMPKADLKKLFRALLKGIEWGNDPANHDELSAFLDEKFEIENFLVTKYGSMEAFRKAFSDYFAKKDELYALNSGFHEVYTKMITVREEIGLPNYYSYDEIVDTSALLEVLEEMGLADTP